MNLVEWVKNIDLDGKITNDVIDALRTPRHVSNYKKTLREMALEAFLYHDIHHLEIRALLKRGYNLRHTRYLYVVTRAKNSDVLIELLDAGATYDGRVVTTYNCGIDFIESRYTARKIAILVMHIIRKKSRDVSVVIGRVIWANRKFCCPLTSKMFPL